MVNIISRAICAQASDRKYMTKASIKELLSCLAYECDNASTKMEQFSCLFYLLSVAREFPILSPEKYDAKFLYNGYKLLNDRFSSCMGNRRKKLVASRQKEMLLRLRPKTVANQFSLQKSKTAGISVTTTEKNFKKLTISSE